MKTMSFVSAMLDYFTKNGKSSTEFMQEMKALSTDDRAWFRANLPSVGYNITDTINT